MFHVFSIICSYSFPLSPCIISHFSVYKELAERTAVKVDVQQAAAAGRFGPAFGDSPIVDGQHPAPGGNYWQL